MVLQLISPSLPSGIKSPTTLHKTIFLSQLTEGKISPSFTAGYFLFVPLLSLGCWIFCDKHEHTQIDALNLKVFQENSFPMQSIQCSSAWRKPVIQSGAKGPITNQRKPFIIKVSRLFNLDKAQMLSTSNYVSSQSQTPFQTLRTTNPRTNAGSDAVLSSPPPFTAKQDLGWHSNKSQEDNLSFIFLQTF